MSIFSVNTGALVFKTRSEVESEIDVIARAYGHGDFEFRIRKGSEFYHFGKGIHDPLGPNGTLYVDRATPWHSAGKTIYIAIARQLELEGILTRNTLVRAVDPALASTPQSELLTVGMCGDQTHAYGTSNNPHWNSAPRNESAGYALVYAIPTDNPTSKKSW